MSKDNIELPPLPLERAVLESGVKVYAEYTLRQYAREAIKADRQKRFEPGAARQGKPRKVIPTYAEPYDFWGLQE